MTEVVVTTLDEILSGRFPSARDKYGTGGVVVRVEMVFVEFMHPSPEDGDWHIYVSDAKHRFFTCERKPVRPFNIALPPIGRHIDIDGYVFCDPAHVGNYFHSEGKCWEIHPITRWNYSRPGMWP